MADKGPKYDGKFHAFQVIAELLDILLPKGYQLDREQAAAVHLAAKTLSDDLTSGDYE